MTFDAPWSSWRIYSAATNLTTLIASVQKYCPTTTCHCRILSHVVPNRWVDIYIVVKIRTANISSMHNIHLDFTIGSCSMRFQKASPKSAITDYYRLLKKTCWATASTRSSTEQSIKKMFARIAAQNYARSNRCQN